MHNNLLHNYDFVFRILPVNSKKCLMLLKLLNLLLIIIIIIIQKTLCTDNNIIIFVLSLSLPMVVEPLLLICYYTK